MQLGATKLVMSMIEVTLLPGSINAYVQGTEPAVEEIDRLPLERITGAQAAERESSRREQRTKRGSGTGG